jgi:uncharacterized protein YjiS (DUF1127 family)
MADIGLDVPADTLRSPQSAARSVAETGKSIAVLLRKWWIYHRTRAELRGYSERNLRDIGAERGTNEFARRAAGL